MFANRDETIATENTFHRLCVYIAIYISALLSFLIVRMSCSERIRVFSGNGNGEAKAIILVPYRKNLLLFENMCLIIIEENDGNAAARRQRAGKEGRGQNSK